MKRPGMKLKKHNVSKRQQRSINKLPQDKRAFVRRRILMGDTLRQAKKRTKPINE
jgi:ribosomal protein L44E